MLWLWPRIRVGALWCSMLMIHGCAQSPPPASLGPVVVETTPIRCPELDAKLKLEAKRRTARPTPTPIVRPDGSTKLGHSPDAIRRWISALEVSEDRKGQLLDFAIAEYERCRSGAPPAS